MTQPPGEARYTSGEYAADATSWHEADAEWKAAHVARLMSDFGISPRTICDLGCGTGGVLDHLGSLVPGVEHCVGYEISAAAVQLGPADRRDRVEFVIGPTADTRTFDVALVLDVFEHVEDYYAFLRAQAARSPRFIFHIPLDLTVLATLRPRQFGRLRTHGGHLHYFTRETALAVLSECGYHVVHDEFTSGAIDLRTTRNQRLLSLPRRFARALSKPLAARTLGGFSLLVLADNPAFGGSVP